MTTGCARGVADDCERCFGAGWYAGDYEPEYYCDCLAGDVLRAFDDGLTWDDACMFAAGATLSQLRAKKKVSDG